MDANKLRIALEEGERWRRRLSVTVPADVVRAERERIAGDLASRVKLPGFRGGKVPRSVVEKRYGGALRQETLDKVINSAYRQALQRESLRPISEGEVEDVRYEADEDLEFSISFDVQPEIQLGRLGGFAVERPSITVTDQDVDGVLRRLLQQHGAWRPVEEGGAQEGDLASVEIQPLKDAQPDGEPKTYELVLGAGDAIPDIEKAIATLAPGEVGDFTVRFPEDFSNEARRGQEQQVRITLQTRRVRELPELDDAFAASVGEFQTVEDLRARIREDLEREAREEAEGAVRSRLLDLLLEANPFEVPRSMVDRYVKQILGDLDGVPEDRLAELTESIRPDAERAVKRILVVERIADTQGLRATEEELDERVEAIAARNQASPAEVYARLQKSGGLETLEREVTERKVFEFLKAKSEIRDAA